MQQYTDKSMIDLIITNNKTLFNDVRAIPSESFDSDHRMVVGRISMRLQIECRGPTRNRICIENLEDENRVMQLQERVRENAPTQPLLDIEQEWAKFRDTVVKASEDILETKRVGRTKKKKTAWWTEEVKHATQLKNKAFRRWMKTRQIEDRNEYIRRRNEAETVKREAKRESWNKIGKDLEQDMNGTRKLIYYMARSYRKGNTVATHSIKDKEGSLLTDPSHISRRWREYFEELLNVAENMNMMDVENEVENEQEAEPMQEITTEEVKEAVKRMKNGKAPGDDRLPADIIKKLGEEEMIWLTRLINLAWSSCTVPEDWGRAVICPIHKKGDKADCNNYRGISLLSHISKIYERILERRLREVVENKLGEWQHGFRPGRGTLDLIFVLKLLLEKSWEWNKPRFVGFIDLQKAFDRVPRERLWSVLRTREYSIPSDLVRAIKSIYTHCESRVKSEDRRGEWFEVMTGVRQGGVLSPLLFILYMDCCMKNIIRENTSKTLAYADDVAVASNSWEELQDELERWNDELNHRGMKMSFTKTEVMRVGRGEEQEGAAVVLDGHEIKRARNFKYLGVKFHERNLQDEEITHRIGKYNENVRMLYPLLKERSIPQKCKITIFTSILRPILIYGSEAWSLTTTLKSRIQAAEMRVLRLIRGVSRIERMRNTTIRQQLGVESVLDIVERGRLRWYGHVMRMGEERLPRQLLDWIPDGRRPVGRPRRRWMDGVEEGLARRGFSIEQVLEDRTYDDRVTWRRLIRGTH